MKINKKIIRFFSCIADETRLKILLSLSGEPRNVSKIHEFVGKNKVTLSAVSHQLKMLTDLDMIVAEKKGRTKLFRRSSDFCWCILNDAFSHFDKKQNQALCKFTLGR